MKQLTSAFLLLLCVCLLCSTVLAGCGSDTQEPTSTHAYAAQWSHDDTAHWHACTDANCAEISEKAQHSFENNVCTVCGYKTAEPVPTLSANQITEEEFKAAITGLTNFTVSYTGKTPTWDEELETITGVEDFDSIMYVTENAIKFTVDKADENALNGDYFLEFAGEQIYEYVPTTPVMKISINSEDVLYNYDIVLDMTNNIQSLKAMLAQINFKDFTYNDGAYIGTVPADINDTDTQIPATLKFKDKQLVYVYIDDSSCYELKSGETYCTYVFSDHGTTTVSLPTDYVDYSNTEVTQWANYFVFDNVTIHLQSTTTTAVQGQSYSSSQEQRLLIQGEKWLLTTPDMNEDLEPYDKTFYFDGTNAYIDGKSAVAEDVALEKDLFLGMINYLAFCGNDFTETSPGIWEASEIAASGANQEGAVVTYGALSNVRLTLQNNKITALSFSAYYDLSDVETGASSTVSYHYTFSDYGTTVVVA